ncbi:hypothetical protein Taro_004374 [Colocasia esculenta]|uniref:Uncharacterized protein n=1 Tax=Colocasia esculenta TaxID=4460 RepID=A0A843TPA9_COLES|nr:hypothetical protein [Colocasia esculenta]
MGSCCEAPVASSAAAFAAFQWFVRCGVHAGTMFGAWVRWWRGGFASLELARVVRRDLVAVLGRGALRFSVASGRIDAICKASTVSDVVWLLRGHMVTSDGPVVVGGPAPILKCLFSRCAIVEVCVVFLKTLTPEFEFALVVGGTSRCTGPQLVLLPVPHFRELGPESLKVPGMGLQSGLRVHGYETERRVCLGGGTVEVVVLWGYLVVVDRVVKALFGVGSCCGAPVASSAACAAFAAFRWFVRRGVHVGTVFGAWVRRWCRGFASLELTRVVRRDLVTVLGPGALRFSVASRRIDAICNMVTSDGPVVVSRVPQVLCELDTLCLLCSGFVPVQCGTIEVCVVFLDTLTPEFELYVWLRERRQRAATCVELVLRLVACSALVVGVEVVVLWRYLVVVGTCTPRGGVCVVVP